MTAAVADFFHLRKKLLFVPPPRSPVAAKVALTVNLYG